MLILIFGDDNDDRVDAWLYRETESTYLLWLVLSLLLLFLLLFSFFFFSFSSMAGMSNKFISKVFSKENGVLHGLADNFSSAYKKKMFGYGWNVNNLQVLPTFVRRNDIVEIYWNRPLEWWG